MSYTKHSFRNPKNGKLKTLLLTGAIATSTILSIVGLTGQTGNLVSYKNSSETELAGVEADGTHFAPDYVSRYDDAGEFSVNAFFDSFTNFTALFDFGSPSNGHVLTYNSSTERFEPQAAAGGSPGGNSGNIQFNNSGSFSGTDDFFWDNANLRLGIGNSAPDNSLTIGTTLTTFDPQIRFYRSGGGQFRIYMNSSQVGFYGTKDMFIATNAGGREIYLAPEGPVSAVLESRGYAWGTSTLPANTKFYILGSGTTGDDTFHVADNSANTLLKVEEDGEIVQSSPNAVPADSTLVNGSISFYLDESSNELKAKVKYSDGTIKTATISLP